MIHFLALCNMGGIQTAEYNFESSEYLLIQALLIGITFAISALSVQ